jgi:hypothetical protein
MSHPRAWRALVLALLFASGTAFANQNRDQNKFVGTWVMQVASRNLFVLTLADRGGEIHGTLARPAQMRVIGGSLLLGMSGQRIDKIVKSRFVDGALFLTIQNASDATDQDDLRMTVEGDQAQLALQDLPPGLTLEPSAYRRSRPGATIAQDWNPDRAYVIGDSDTPSAEMKSIYDQDQKAREGKDIDWNKVNDSDAARRVVTKKLLDAGTLRTGIDYREAAFVFQHGNSADDYLLAHTLAMVAVTKGDAESIWIAAATLDRYLQKINQKQIYGTQFVSGSNAASTTQEPYDRTLVSDALRRQLGVPVQAAQAETLKMYREQK